MQENEVAENVYHERGRNLLNEMIFFFQVTVPTFFQVTVPG